MIRYVLLIIKQYKQTYIATDVPGKKYAGSTITILGWDQEIKKKTDSCVKNKNFFIKCSNYLKI